MKNIIAGFFDPLFAIYIKRLWGLKAFSAESAVTKEKLFPEGMSYIDSDRLQKMLVSGVVRSSEHNKYWLDRKQYFKVDDFSKRRLNILLVLIVIAIIFCILPNLL